MKFERAMTEHRMPLYVFNMPHMGSVTCGVLVFAGTVDEKWPEEAGLAHAYEHMVFHGNDRKHSSQSVAGEIEEIGGDLNAHTWKEETFYYRTVPKNEFRTAVMSLASQLTTPMFKAENIEKEMQVVCEEIKMSQDSHPNTCYYELIKMLYGTHPLAKETLGMKESVMNFKSIHFKNWQERYYHPRNFVFIAVGNIAVQEALDTINSLPFENFSGGENVRKSTKIVEVQNRVIIEREMEQANTYMGVTIGPARDKDSDALEIYTQMVSGGMSFPLFQEVREKRGLCYSVGASISNATDYGVFAVYTGTAKERIAEATECISEVIWSNRNNRELFERAKKMVLGSLAVRFDSPGHILHSALERILYHGKPISPQEIITELEGITLEDVTSAVEKYLHPDRFSYAHVVPKGTVIR